MYSDRILHLILFKMKCQNKVCIMISSTITKQTCSQTDLDFSHYNPQHIVVVSQCCLD